MRSVPVAKLHGTHNDFVLIDERTPQLTAYPDLAKKWCERHGSIGADGLLVIAPSLTADVKMRIFNPDGGEAEMCGNGIRCLARYLHEAGAREDLRVETTAGVIETHVESHKDGNYWIRVKLGPPKFEKRELTDERATFVSLGNPHVVLFVKGLDDVDLDATAASFNAKIPGGTNVHVAAQVTADRFVVRHVERGAGKTLACGTGAVAVAVAAISRGLTKSPVFLDVPGGRLMVEWDGIGEAFLHGDAVRVFDTTMPLGDHFLLA